VTRPSIPSGTRDFSPAEMQRRNFFFDAVRAAFARYGYQPLETPAIEYLATLTGKYGDEGDKLIFKILNSGDYLADVPAELLAARDARALLPRISDKALRYDLTVPFARFVAMRQHELQFPFKRYQIQPVWRADRPQKGRYREFVQCDADVVGSTSLLNEVELLQIVSEVFAAIGIGVVVKLNHRKVLSGIAAAAGAPDKLVDLTVAIDKLDKVGPDKVEAELRERGFAAPALAVVRDLMRLSGSNEARLAGLRAMLLGNETGERGLTEIEELLRLARQCGTELATLQFDPVLARGLGYYTGPILEVKVDDPRSTFTSSICGGGRYDDLTGVFGLPNVPGVGVSFGADRVCDVLQEVGAAAGLGRGSRLMVANFGAAELPYVQALAARVRAAGVAVELYPDTVKLKKQLAYANARGIPFVAIAGEDEVAAKDVTLKDLRSGEQRRMSVEAVIDAVRGS